MKALFTPPYSRLTALLAAVIALATEFTDPAAYPVLLAAFGPLWTKSLIAACGVVILVSRSVKEPTPAAPKAHVESEADAVLNTFYTPVTPPKEQSDEDDPSRRARQRDQRSGLSAVAHRGLPRMTTIITGVDGPTIAESTSEFQIKPRVTERLAPFGDRVVVLPDSAEEMIGSFYVPDIAQERPARGTVVAVGPGIMLDNGSILPLSVQVGDRVIYGHFTGAEAQHEGQTVLILRETDLFATVIVA